MVCFFKGVVFKEWERQNGLFRFKDTVFSDGAAAGSSSEDTIEMAAEKRDWDTDRTVALPTLTINLLSQLDS